MGSASVKDGQHARRTAEIVDLIPRLGMPIPELLAAGDDHDSTIAMVIPVDVTPLRGPHEVVSDQEVPRLISFVSSSLRLLDLVSTPDHEHEEQGSDCSDELRDRHPIAKHLNHAAP